jgi:glycosidase
MPRIIFDAVGFTVNRDEVRTPMQWDGTKNAGFSSAEKTWLPLHRNHATANVEKQRGDPSSLLSTVRALMEIRRQSISLQEGSLELIEGLPAGVLGYSRTAGGERLAIFLNFGERNTDFSSPAGICVFRLNELDRVEATSVHLGGFGGMILKSAGEAG